MVFYIQIKAELDQIRTTILFAPILLATKNPDLICYLNMRPPILIWSNSLHIERSGQVWRSDRKWPNFHPKLQQLRHAISFDVCLAREFIIF